MHRQASAVQAATPKADALGLICAIQMPKNSERFRSVQTKFSSVHLVPGQL